MILGTSSTIESRQLLSTRKKYDEKTNKLNAAFCHNPNMFDRSIISQDANYMHNKHPLWCGNKIKFMDLRKPK